MSLCSGNILGSQGLRLCLIYCGSVSRLCVSHDEAHLFTASEDGQLFMFELLGEGAAQRERSRRNQEDAGQELDTVLVSKAELLERIAAAEELERRHGCDGGRSRAGAKTREVVTSACGIEERHEASDGVASDEARASPMSRIGSFDTFSRVVGGSRVEASVEMSSLWALPPARLKVVVVRALAPFPRSPRASRAPGHHGVP